MSNNNRLAPCWAAVLLFTACSGGGGGGSPAAGDDRGHAHGTPISSYDCGSSETDETLRAFLERSQGSLRQLNYFQGQAPTLYVIREDHVSPAERATNALAVEGVCASLPLDRHISIVEVAEVQARLQLRDARRGDLILQESPRYDWFQTCNGPNTYACTTQAVRGTVGSQAFYIWVHENLGGSRLKKQALVTHELLDALGLWNHSDRRDSLTYPDNFAPGGHALRGNTMYPIDRAALVSLYRLGRGGRFDELGPWNFDPATIETQQGLVALGAEAANPHVRPWVQRSYGPDRVSDGQTLSGSASWRGPAIGLTTDARRITGGSRLSLDLWTMGGELSLDLSGYPDLRYDVELTSYGLTRTGGDAGTVYGHLYDSDRTAAGTVHRADAGVARAGRR